MKESWTRPILLPRSSVHTPALSLVYIMSSDSDLDGLVQSIETSVVIPGKLTHKPDKRLIPQIFPLVVVFTIVAYDYSEHYFVHAISF